MRAFDKRFDSRVLAWVLTPFRITTARRYENRTKLYIIIIVNEIFYLLDTHSKLQTLRRCDFEVFYISSFHRLQQYAKRTGNDSKLSARSLCMLAVCIDANHCNEVAIFHTLSSHLYKAHLSSWGTNFGGLFCKNSTSPISFFSRAT